MVPLAILGIIVGIITGLVVNLFRYLLETTMPFFTNGLHHEHFEQLPSSLHFFLPLTGCIIIGLLLHGLTPELRRMGVSYVIDKVQHFRTHMSFRNALMQFITASIALLTGGSCGREGPSIHLGASSAGLLGYWLKLPNNSIRTIIAGGSAAAIAAAFNTPIAGVIFAMEVIMMEYALTGIVPVIVAAVSGVVVTQIFYGDQPIFMIQSIAMASLWQIPWVALMGLVIGSLASLFVILHKHACSFSNIDIRLRLLITGILTGSVAFFIPEIMGMGYDTLNQLLQENMALSFLLLFLLAKLIVTAVGIGLGLPGGLIGPTLVLGGTAGAVMGMAGESILPGINSSPAFYVLIGMCAMMGACLQAPLASLMALLELSDNPNIILPAMIIIVVANLTSSEIFRTPSIFKNSLANGEMSFSPELARFLNRYGISTVAHNNYIRLDPESDKEVIKQSINSDIDWFLIDYEGEDKALVSKDSLTLALEKEDFNLETIEQTHSIAPVSNRATLLEAMERMADKSQIYGYLSAIDKRGNTNIAGVFSQDDIIAFYRGTR